MNKGLVRVVVALGSRRVVRVGAASCLVAGLVVTGAWAGIDPTPFRTGLFGVTAGQTVRVSVLNTGHRSGVINPCWKIWDHEGNLLFEADMESVKAGTGTFVDFELAPRPDLQRLQLRAEVEFERARDGVGPPPDDGTPPPEDGRVRRRDVILTLEVFDTATGRTTSTVQFAHPPDPVRVR